MIIQQLKRCERAHNDWDIEKYESNGEKEARDLDQVPDWADLEEAMQQRPFCFDIHTQEQGQTFAWTKGTR